MKEQILNKFFRPSTRAFLVEGQHTPKFSMLDWLHGYVYSRWPYFYIGIGTGEHRLTKTLGPLLIRLLRLTYSSNGDTPVMEALPQTASKKSPGTRFADTYHGKVVPLESAKKLVTINQEVNLTNLEQVIPYAHARDIVMRNPDHIVVLECPCRTSRPNPCTPLDVCLIVGEPFAGFVTEHHPTRSRWISQQEAEEILEAEHKRGHVHHAFFKDAMLGRFYAICNCCSCCCGAMQAVRNGVPMLASSGYVSHIDEDQCIVCGECAAYCQFEAISVDGWVTVDSARCMGCGVCVDKCEQEAITLIRDSGKSKPLEIQKLMEMAGK